MICVVRFLTYIMALCCLREFHLLPLMASTWAEASQIPNPQKDFKLCGGDRTRAKWVCDPDHLLLDTEVNEINRLLETIRYNTTCACHDQSDCQKDGAGFAVSVAIKKSLPNRSRPVTATSYAKYLRQNEWRFSACEDDVVVVITSTKGQVKGQLGISYGINAERYLELVVIEDILRNARNFYETSTIREAILLMLNNLRDAFLRSYKRRPPFPVWTVVHMLLGSSFVLCCFCSMYICRLLYSQ